MFVFYGISPTGMFSRGVFGWTDELSGVEEYVPEHFEEVWSVDLSDIVRWRSALPRDAAELRFMGVPCCCECGDAGSTYHGARCSVVWCEACAADLLPLLEVE